LLPVHALHPGILRGCRWNAARIRWAT
jgi:hypothetical protein